MGPDYVREREKLKRCHQCIPYLSNFCPSMCPNNVSLNISVKSDHSDILK